MTGAAKQFRIWLSLLILVSTSACATRPFRSNRVGLLDKNFESNIGDPSQTGVGASSDFQLPGEWVWPLKNVDVSSHYGHRGRKFHQGVDLRAHIGTPVLAAYDGTVVYVGSRIRGYGRMIVIKHDDQFYSVYAHHSKNLVKAGKVVKKGEKIALSGRSGRASGPHLHFEIRRGVESYDPYLAITQNMNRYLANRKVASEGKQ
jgi:murein DD-endopeptidase MepM/ murein hydrolase activator NlpD